MKRFKLFGPIVVAATALMALAATASATTVTDSGGGTTPTIHAVSEDDPDTSGVHVSIHNAASDIECNSTFTNSITTHGSGVTAAGHNSAFSFSSCTGGWAVTVLSKGTLNFHTISTTGHGTATVTSSGLVVRTCFFGCAFVECVYGTAATDIGEMMGGNPATLFLEGLITFIEGSAVCGEEASFITGSYVTTGTLKFDA